MEKIWSSFQTAFFNFVENAKGNAILIAVAGSGKTTTVVEALKKCYGDTIFLAFNKAIATELKDRGVNAKTFHALCLPAVVNAKKGRKIEGGKTGMVIRETLSQEQRDLYGGFIPKLVGLAKQSGIDCLIANTPEHWMQIVEHHDLELDHDDADMATAITLSQQILADSNAHPTLIDYDDMLYLAVKEGLTLPKFQFIFVDEAQDTNAIQRAILKKMHRKYGTRLFAVGDPAQAIYGFRGADSNSMNLIRDEFKCEEMPLTVSYRCSKKIVEFAQQWVGHITATDTAPDGEVLNFGQEWKSEQMNAADIVVCRTTRPLIALGYKMLRDRKPFYIMGRDIGQGLRKLVEKQKAKGIDQLLAKLSTWHAREVEKAVVKDQEAKVEALNDKYESLIYLIEHLPETERTVPALCNVIDSLFAEKSNATILCTIHKSKGLEADVVWWLNASQCPSQWAKKEWQQQQEINLCYVATTRAKTRLVLIEERQD